MGTLTFGGRVPVRLTDRQYASRSVDPREAEAFQLNQHPGPQADDFLLFVGVGSTPRHAWNRRCWDVFKNYLQKQHPDLLEDPEKAKVRFFEQVKSIQDAVNGAQTDLVVQNSRRVESQRYSRRKRVSWSHHDLCD